ncbi:DUF423 domain-containing protein [Reichenbachiella ulvae]|uniref:DUF423 domain-containing protein n=1 Tax=Reichenbachiella ulvae TaxID=2980104 RepID=A0ABT3CRS0_9BACT|nr:DUF423 domain-containing protein [Reichenbachiella ulvae]MCV9386406.1 DUF423 domain-containing protein [Reichenbachiella ulvae]
MNNNVIKTGAVFGFLTVAIGAFGAHGLKSTLIAHGTLDTFDTGVLYQAIHTFAILITGILFKEFHSSRLNWAFYSFVAGIIIFSGSLYILSVTGIKVWGAITPVGGIGFLVGWILMLLAVNKKRDTE